MLSTEDSIWEKSVILLQSAMYFFFAAYGISLLSPALFLTKYSFYIADVVISQVFFNSVIDLLLS